jgi:hypothetical protein
VASFNAAERRFDRSGVELSQDAADRRVGGCFPPLQAERNAQSVEVDIDEAVDRPVGIGASDDRQDREQHHVRQSIQLALGPPWVFDFGQQGDKRSERRHATPSAAVKVASQGVRQIRVAGIPYAAVRGRFASARAISDSLSPRQER